MSLELAFATVASLFAGLIDSIVGGGGLILVPALFATFPSAPPATLLGTNKCAGVWGTAMATARFARRVRMPWRTLVPAAGAALLGSFAGAWLVTAIDPGFLRRLLPLVLLAVLIYTLVNKTLGNEHAPLHSGRTQTLVACAIGAAVGWYDGFFGPGAGSFFIFLFVRFLGFDFLNAAASAKVLNVATNLAALTLFAIKGHIWWQVGLTMAIANVIGSLFGAHLALKHGAGFVRIVFVVVVAALIVKTSYDAFLR
ncbi:TSUP family transporter [Schlegelella sp. ID0723]|uniref:Probable membrane transporter protein n=1 Tax=Piscinibacter koreensis TaxID=2742824 RepID=A0A7Y6NLL0_9BURK|nr:TSUP family transporter [Schlegelella koreensis]NUZ05379.1 TSUP family transporter [Schlegelella koreensis]